MVFFEQFVDESFLVLLEYSETFLYHGIGLLREQVTFLIEIVKM